MTVDQTAFSPTASSPTHPTRPAVVTRTMLQEQVHRLYNANLALIANIVNSSIVAAAAFATSPTLPLFAWLGAMWLICAGRFFLARVYRRTWENPERAKSWGITKRKFG